MSTLLKLTRREIEAMDAAARAKARTELMALDLDFQRIQREAKANGDNARRLLHMLNAAERAENARSRFQEKTP